MSWRNILNQKTPVLLIQQCRLITLIILLSDLFTKSVAFLFNHLKHFYETNAQIFIAAGKTY